MGRPLAIHLAVSSLRVIEVYRGVLGNIDRIATLAAVADALSESGAAEASVDGSTIAAVAARSGADKETVRRRVVQLVEDGILRRTRDGRVRVDPAFVRRPTFLGAMRRHAAAAARLANNLCDQGVLTGREAGYSVCVEPSPEVNEAIAWETALTLLSSLHRSLVAFRNVSGTTDHVLVLLGVIAITSQHLTRGELPDGLEDLREPIPRDKLGVTNVSSIAVAAGLPLETTRRKTAELIAKGSLVRDDAGNIQFTPGVLQQSFVYDMITRNAAEAVALANRLWLMGVLTTSKGAAPSTPGQACSD